MHKALRAAPDLGTFITLFSPALEWIKHHGMEEVGIYCGSGVATDIQALKAAFVISRIMS
ncbi:hypothetical protein P7K49_029678 [Saguinus oedipus]|uniref:Uncharacterized protein n=1 Tax=Saguinus oedipus TaxID=9490 RepID=A0ABQ9U7T6_SAGOE|nr:hypothetical protein P7K49_029661 [Saguinus oedipus]KAK2093149.1 hypothetical protein P7K49_029678 [Saguinus oedipus]